MCASDQTSLSKGTRLLLWGVLACSMSGGALAQADKEQEQLKRLKLQLRQVQQEQAATQDAQAKSEAGRLGAEKALKEMQSALQVQRTSAGQAARKLTELSKERDALQQERDALKDRLTQLEAQLAESSRTAQVCQGDMARAQLQWQEQVQTLSGGLERCRTHNAELYVLGTGLLQRYENKGLGEVLGASEPFVQVARVQLENTRATYQDKLDAAQEAVLRKK